MARHLHPINVLFLLVLGCATALAQSGTNQTVLARATLARTEILIGDQIWLEINVSAPPGTEVESGAADALAAEITVEAIEVRPLGVTAEEPERLFQQRIKISAYDPGTVLVPALPFYHRPAGGGGLDTAYTEPLNLTVEALPVEEESELQPIKPIIEEPRNWLDFWPFYVIALLGAVGYLTYRNYRAPKRVAPPPPPPPADLKALNALTALEERNLWAPEQTKEYYSELTRILRVYLEDRFGVQAMEMTSRQIATQLKTSAELNEAQRREMGELFQLSDLVKFAKATPTEALHRQNLQRVRDFVKETRKVELPSERMGAPAPAPAPGRGAASVPTPIAPAAAPPVAAEPPRPDTPPNAPGDVDDEPDFADELPPPDPEELSQDHDRLSGNLGAEDPEKP